MFRAILEALSFVFNPHYRSPSERAARVRRTGWRCDSCGTIAVQDRRPVECPAAITPISTTRRVRA